MFKRGTIVLVPFPFTDLSDEKVRPAVIISAKLRGDDVVVAFISSQRRIRLEPTDLALTSNNPGFQKSGLKTDSIIRLGKIATLDKKLILGELGQLDFNLQQQLSRKLKLLLGLD